MGAGQGMIILVRDYLQQIFELENSLEITRKELAYRRDFSLSTAFACFSKSLQYRVSVDEFLFGLERLDINLL